MQTISCLNVGRIFLLGLSAIAFTKQVNAQNLKTDAPSVNLNSGKLLTDMIDTTTAMGRNMFSLYNKYGNLGFSGYIQPQFQYAQVKGPINIYQGGDWGKFSDNRFRLRRGRLRADYAYYNEDGSPSIYFILQFDGTERGVNIRDFWGRYYENKFKLFHFSSGMMARPFGYEVLYSSMFREAPERGRMSQILMSTERDLGFMFSFNSRRPHSKIKWLGVDLGIYNGQGLTGTTEYDSHKDVVVRVSSKRQTIQKLGGIKVSGGLSGFFGGITSQGQELIKMKKGDQGWRFENNTAASNEGKAAARRYFGGDIQIVIPNKVGQTEFRAEYIRGLQTGTQSSSTTPGSYPVNTANEILPLVTRPFDGAYFYFLQNLGSTHHQIVLKYDWYDPNTRVKGQEISATNGFTSADIKFTTIAGGYLHYVNPYMKLLFWYEYPINEHTGINGYTKNVKDGIFTFRTQFNF